MNNFDVNILERARKFDQKAVSQLCEHYYPKILKFMYYRVGPNQADDLTGEVFLKVIRSLGRQNGRFEPWLYKIARNVIIDSSRKVKAKQEVQAEEKMLEKIPSPSDHPKEIASSMDIETALQQLNDDQQELLTLKFIQGLNNSEIETITGKSLGAIRAMQFRALTTLRETMYRQRT